MAASEVWQLNQSVNHDYMNKIHFILKLLCAVKCTIVDLLETLIIDWKKLTYYMQNINILHVAYNID